MNIYLPCLYLAKLNFWNLNWTHKLCMSPKCIFASNGLWIVSHFCSFSANIVFIATSLKFLQHSDGIRSRYWVIKLSKFSQWIFGVLNSCQNDFSLFKGFQNQVSPWSTAEACWHIETHDAQSSRWRKKIELSIPLPLNNLQKILLKTHENWWNLRRNDYFWSGSWNTIRETWSISAIIHGNFRAQKSKEAQNSRRAHEELDSVSPSQQASDPQHARIELK